MASVGLRARPLRAALSALGIAIGTAAIVGVLGLSVLLAGRAARGDRSTRHEPPHRRGRTELHRWGGEAARSKRRRGSATLTTSASADTAAVLKDVKVYRNSMIPVVKSGGLEVRATSLNLLTVLGTVVARGDWLNEGTARSRSRCSVRSPRNGWASIGSTAGPADLARRPVVRRRWDPGALAAGARDRQQRLGRLSRPPSGYLGYVSVAPA